jgi:hypothetical protein
MRNVYGVVMPADEGVSVAEWERPGTIKRGVEEGGDRERQGRNINKLETTCGKNTLKLLEQCALR